METSIAQRNALTGSFEDYLSHAGLIQNALIAMSGPQQAPPMATLLYTGEDSPTQTPEPSGAPRNTSEDFTINGLDFEYSQEIDTALYEARALLSPILAKMCPTITKKGRKPLPITDWVRNSAKNRTHMDAIGSLALQSELIQLAQDDQCTELERVYLLSCFSDEKVLGELVKLIIFGIPSAICVEPTGSYAKFITLLVGMTLGNQQLTKEDEQSATPAIQSKQKPKKGSKFRQSKAGNRSKEHHRGNKAQSSEKDGGTEANGAQVEDPPPKTRIEGDQTLLAYYVARAAYLAWTSDYLQHEMLSSRLSTTLSLRHPTREGSDAMKPAQCVSFTETIPERIARETVMREVMQREDNKVVRAALWGMSLSRDPRSAHSEDLGGETSASAIQLHCQLEKFLNFEEITPTESNAFRDLMNCFSGGADEPETFGGTPLEQLICLECFHHLSLDSQEARVLDSLRCIDTALEIPTPVVSPRDSPPEFLASQHAEPVGSRESGVRLLSEGAVVRVYSDSDSKGARYRMWSELYKCFLQTYMAKIALRCRLFLLAVPHHQRSSYADELIQRSCCRCFHELEIPTCHPVKYSVPQDKWNDIKQAEQVVADWFPSSGKDQ